MTIEELIQRAVPPEASDLHLVEGYVPRARLHGALRELQGPSISEERFTALLYTLLADDLREAFTRGLDVDTARSLAGERWRIHGYTQRAGRALSLRRIPNLIPDLAGLGLPEGVHRWGALRSGLVLITGPTGSGKSTTAAALLDLINGRDARHVVTIENPIEFLHNNRSCLVSQREVGAHVGSFTDALRSALREDPDIIFVGEMRDLETIRLALQAAETGHLVISTLHTSSAAKTVARVVDVFPAEQQPQIRAILADTLEGIVAQELVVNRQGERSLVAEVLLATPAVRSLIRDGKTHHLEHVIQTSASVGMRSREASLRGLRERGLLE
jgi:twitching motility protein PilT